MYKLLSLLFLCVWFAKPCVAQTAAVQLDSLTFTMVNVQDNNDINPFPPDHPQYKEPKVEILITFTISNLDSLKIIDIAFEKEKGKRDFKTFTLTHTVAEGKSYLTVGNRIYPIEKSKAYIKEQLPSKLVNGKTFFTLKAIDKKNVSGNVLLREFN